MEKKYYKIEDNKFKGFYLDSHPEFISEPEKFTEIDDEKWLALLEEQSKGKVIIYKDGKLETMELPTRPIGVKLEFNYDTEQWEETATIDEQKDFWKDKIIFLTRESLIYQQAGFPSHEIDKQLEEAKKQYRLLEPTY